ncbi:hypothetical protein HanLR1_Chr17g0667511 [Helianthus annuus]|nr:hypothetical protein HanLR1_Chr17g0667511 [Helianthus annuus]
MLGTELHFVRRRCGEDRFYNPAKARRNQKNQENPCRVQSTTSSGPMLPESSPLCNLDGFWNLSRLLFLLNICLRGVRGWRTSDPECQPYFVLGDLWEAFKEWSAYGAGFPLMLDDTDSVIQYYVPYLSGIQIYGDPLKSSTKSSDASSDYEHEREKESSYLSDSEMCRRMNQLSMNDQHHVLQEGFSSDDGDSVSSEGCLLFEYMERNQPWGREPLADKILDLARCFPELKRLRSCDLLPSSWFSVPNIQDSMGSSKKDLDACFLTFHSLHPPVAGQSKILPNKSSECNQCDHPPVFKPQLWVHNEPQLVSDLLQAADSWLTMLRVNHPDYLFFPVDDIMLTLL